MQSRIEKKTIYSDVRFVLCPAMASASDDVTHERAETGDDFAFGNRPLEASAEKIKTYPLPSSIDLSSIFTLDLSVARQK